MSHYWKLEEIAASLNVSEAELATTIGPTLRALEHNEFSIYDSEAREAIEWAWEQAGGNNRHEAPVQPKKSGKEWYKEYLKTDVWKEKREVIFASHGKTCVLCDSPVNLEIHHRRYRDPRTGKSILGKETPHDCTVLCKRCHGWFETLKKTWD